MVLFVVCVVFCVLWCCMLCYVWCYGLCIVVCCVLCVLRMPEVTQLEALPSMAQHITHFFSLLFLLELEFNLLSKSDH